MVLVGQRRLDPRPRGAKRRLVEDVRGRSLDRPRPRLVQRQRLHRGRQRGGVAWRELRVQRADLHRADARVRPQLPPVEGVVGHLGDVRQARGGVQEVVEVGHRARHARARPRAQRQRPRGRQAGVAAVAVGRVGAQRLEQRQVAAQAVEDADRGVGVGHADVDVQRADRRRAGVAEQLVDALVAALLGELRVALDGGRVRAAGDDPGAGGEHRTAQLAELLDGLRDGRADAGDELDLAAVQLVLDVAAGQLAELLDHLGAGVDEVPVGGVDEEELLLQADRERLAVAEVMLLVLIAHLGGGLTRPAAGSAVAGGELDDRRIDEPLDRRDVVGVDAPAAQARLQARRGGQPDRAQLGGQPGRARQQPVARGGRGGGQQLRVDVLARVAQDGREDRAHRRHEHLLQARRVARVTDVDEHDAAGAQPLLDEREELLRREVERDVRLAVGIDEDRVVALLRAAQERPRVGGERAQPRAAHVEVAPPDVGQLTVDLDRVDRRLREEVPVGARDGAGGVAEDRHARGRAVAHRERQHERLVPVVVGQVGIAPPQRVHRLALVELERARAVEVLHDAGVLVLGVGLVDDARAGLGLALDRADRQDEQDREHGRGEQRRAARQPPGGDDDERQAEEDERASRADERDEQQRARERAQQRADGGDRVQAPGDRAGLRDVADGEPERIRRDRAGDEHRGGDEHGDAEQRADERAGGDRVQRVDGDAEEGVGDERHGGEQQARQQDDPVQALAGRVAVGQTAAVPVADRQRDEHDPDRVRPDDRRGAEVRREQARGGDLGAEDARPDDEDDEAERGFGQAAHAAASVLRRARRPAHRGCGE